MSLCSHHHASDTVHSHSASVRRLLSGRIVVDNGEYDSEGDRPGLCSHRAYFLVRREGKSSIEMLAGGKCYSENQTRLMGSKERRWLIFCWETREDCFSAKVTFKPRPASQEGASHGKIWWENIPCRQHSTRELPEGTSGPRTVLINNNHGLWWLSSQESTSQHRSCRFDQCVGKIPWRRKWQSTLVFLLGNPMGREDQQATVHGVQKSQT